jgi:hypothetical protein
MWLKACTGCPSYPLPHILPPPPLLTAAAHLLVRSLCAIMCTLSSPCASTCHMHLHLTAPLVGSHCSQPLFFFSFSSFLAPDAAAAPAPAGAEQEALAKEAGFRSAQHYEVGFGFMGVLVATK